jgi:hypothetical protein
MNIALIMMQKNEDHLLWPWVRYHGSRFGYKNCHVFDNGSCSSLVRRQLGKAEELGVHVMYEHNQKADFGKKYELIKGKIDELRALEAHQAFIPLDCDEFVAILDSTGISLQGDLVLRHISELHRKGDYYLRVSTRYLNSPVKRDQFYSAKLEKVIFLPESRSGKGGPGFHMRNLSAARLIPTRLAYIEFHNRPYEQVLCSAREKLALRVPDFSVETLKKYKGLGHHLTKYFLMTEQQYLHRAHNAKEMVEIKMSAEFRKLDVAYPFLEEADH